MTTDAKILEQSFYDARWNADKELPTASFTRSLRRARNTTATGCIVTAQAIRYLSMGAVGPILKVY